MAHVKCSRCGKRVSREVDGSDLIVRAFVECHECIEKNNTCEGCRNLKGKSCLLGTNHCTRRAEDYYSK
jgi:hypothetical protein